MADDPFATSPPVDKHAGLKKCLKVIYLIIMLFYSVYSVIMASIAFAKFSKITGKFQGLMHTWKQDLIVDIKAVTASTACPTDYQLLYNYKWPGTVDGCDCRSITDTSIPNSNSTLERKIYRATCNSTQTTKGCGFVIKTPAKDLTNYKGATYCIKRLAGKNFINLGDKLQTDGNCVSGYKKCGGSTDAMYSVCVDTKDFATACPVSDIADTAVSPDHVQMPSSTLYYVNTKGNVAESVISEVLLNENGVCDGQWNATTTSGSNHPLMTTDIPICTSYDSSYKGIESGIDRVTFFQQNAVPLTSPVAMNTYVLASQQMKTFKKAYPPFKPQCRPDLVKLADNEDEIKSIKSAQTALFVVAIIVAFLLGLIYTIVEIMILCAKNDGQPHKCQKCMDNKQYVNWGVKIIHIAILIWAVVVSGKVRGYFLDVGSRKCSDQQTSANLEDLGGQVNDYVYIQNRNSLIVTALMLGLDFLIALYKCTCGKKKPQPAPMAPVPLNSSNKGGIMSPDQVSMAAVPTPNYGGGVEMAAGPRPNMGGVAPMGPAPGYNPYPQGGPMQPMPMMPMQQQPMPMQGYPQPIQPMQMGGPAPYPQGRF